MLRQGLFRVIVDFPNGGVPLMSRSIIWTPSCMQARLGIATQQGAMALQRLRQGARQTARVEHVQVTQVAPGGQAVVAGHVGVIENLERCRRSSWRHGHYSAESQAVRRKARLHVKALRRLIAIAEQVIEMAPPPAKDAAPVR
jgi:hypothetical protein